MPAEYRFSFGPWNISEGADPFGPEVRKPVDFAAKLKMYKPLGFEYVQFHDDDAVPNLDSKTPAEVAREARELRKILDDAALKAEFVAPRLWFDPRTVDGAYTSNDPAHRRYAIDRSLQCVDIANELGCDLVVLWLAREGTYIREAKCPSRAVDQLIEAIDAMLAHDKKIRLAIEPKPNEPTDQAYIPTIGHALALIPRTADPARVGTLIESAHALLAGLDPSDEMAFAMSFDKLWSVHLNDQNGLKYDQDKSFGSVNLRSAFNQVRVLEERGYGSKGEVVGLDVKAMRTTDQAHQTAHLENSRALFLRLVDKVRTYDKARAEECVAKRDYEALERYVVEHLMGK